MRGLSRLPVSFRAAQARFLRTSANTVVGIPVEIFPGERRVAQTPETVKELSKKGFKVCVSSVCSEIGLILFIFDLHLCLA